LPPSPAYLLHERDVFISFGRIPTETEIPIFTRQRVILPAKQRENREECTEQTSPHFVGIFVGPVTLTWTSACQVLHRTITTAISKDMERHRSSLLFVGKRTNDVAYL